MQFRQGLGNFDIQFFCQTLAFFRAAVGDVDAVSALLDQSARNGGCHIAAT